MTQAINLALQGGGAHGAFTWGALDRLLEEDDVEIEGITATSAGAMNAAALKHGWVMGGNAGAREWLDTFWLRVSGLDGVFAEAIMDWLRAVSPAPAVTARLLEASPAVLAASVAARGMRAQGIVFLALLIAPWLAYWALRLLVVERKSDPPGPLLK